MSNNFKWIIILALVAHLVACGVAYQMVGFSGFDQVLAQPWGIVTILDLVLGAVCITAVIFTLEKNWQTAALWSVPIFILGNVVTAVWILIRFRQITTPK